MPFDTDYLQKALHYCLPLHEPLFPFISNRDHPVSSVNYQHSTQIVIIIVVVVAVVVRNRVN